MPQNKDKNKDDETPEQPSSPEILVKLSQLKRIRSAKQGLLTRKVQFFENKQAELDKAGLTHLLDTIDELHKKFEEIEEQIICLDPAFDELNPEDELPISTAAIKFSEDYTNLRIQILALQNSKKMQEKAAEVPVSKCRLPKLELPHFNGELTRWTDFKNEFKSIVHSDKSLTNVDRFRLLKSALEDGPRQVISSIEVTSENYTQAWEALFRRYDNKGMIYRSHVNAIFSLQGASGANIERYRELLDKSQAHYRAMRQMGSFENMADNLLISTLLTKLDVKCQQEWEKYTDETISSWEDFITFLEKYTSTMEKVEQTRRQVQQSFKSTSQPTVSKRQTNLAATGMNKCFKCNSSAHRLKDCATFLKLTPQERINETKRLRVCLKCLSSNHTFKSCRVSCNICKKPHNTLLHLEPLTNNHASTSNDSGNPRSSSTQTFFSSQGTLEQIEDDNALLASVIVTVYDQNGQEFPIHAILDSGSTGNICSERLVTLIGARKYKSQIEIGGIGATSTSSSKRCCIRFSSNYTGKVFEIHASVLKRVTETYPSHEFDTSNWGIPGDIKLADPNFNKPQRVDLLLGGSLFWSLLRPTRLVLRPGLPYVQETELGYIVAGPMHSSNDSNHRTFNSIARSFEERESLKQLVERFWEVDALPDHNEILSPSDQFCEDFYNSTTKRDETGRYIVRLPFRPESAKLGASFDIAKRRFFNIERRLDKFPELKLKYAEFIDEYLKLGHLEVVLDFDESEAHYFLPHHCVVKPSSSSTQVRVVFDASCKTFNGISLNDILFPGPKLQDDLFILLLRFRLFLYVITADIQKMYRQILVDPTDANFQLILWRKFKSDPLLVLRLLTVTYGTAPGAFLAIRTLIQLALDEGQRHPIGASLLRNNFYVDDVLFGLDSIDELRHAAKDLSEILELGGFKLSKYCSNSSEILKDIPKEFQGKFLSINDREVVKTLGLIWQPESDMFGYSYEATDESDEITMRTVLSQIAKLFDPLGFICPVVTKAKIFYQFLWALKLDWDDPLPSELRKDWSSYRSEFCDLKHISIDRHVLPNKSHVELHGFSDASEKAYGACVYLRCKNPDGSFTVRLFCAKSRVAPTKTISIARLELCAAKLLTDLVSRLRNKVLKDIRIENEYFWTDSSIVLHWLNASPHKWKVFVAHRVTKIQASSRIEQWRHIPGNSNPADLISRGTTPKEIAKSDLWWQGPKFLSNPGLEWPAEFVASQSPDEIEDFRMQKFVLTAHIANDLTSSMNFSVDFRGTRRAFAYVHRFIRNCRARVRSRSKSNANPSEIDYSRIVPPTVEEELESEIPFLKSIQRASFPVEYAALESNRAIPNDSKLISLSPFMSDGLIRVGGRLKKALLPLDLKHQILLPKEHSYTNTLVSFFHSSRVAHMGPRMTLCAVRTRYWPLGGLVLARMVCRRCVWCFKLRPKLVDQYMGNLPFDRVNLEHKRPFVITGVDFAGPIVVRHHQRCKVEKKIYLSIFVCFITKAIHVEVVPDLTTEAFIRALKRFVSDRGVVAKMYSDNGRNFVGASNYLAEIRKMMVNGKDQITEACRQLHIEWSFIPPRAPHHGGLWEAAVKITKRLIRNIVGDTNLTEDELATVAKQAAAIANSRPISMMSADPNDFEPLTPGHFLYGCPPAALPEPPVMPRIPDNISSVPLACRMKYVSQQLWKRYEKEYFHLLQPRTKWLVKTGKFKVGAVVLVKQENVDPLRWPLGRIISTKEDKEGIVRIVEVKTASGTFERSVTSIAVLPEEDQSVLTGQRGGVC